MVWLVPPGGVNSGLGCAFRVEVWTSLWVYAHALGVAQFGAVVAGGDDFRCGSGLSSSRRLARISSANTDALKAMVRARARRMSHPARVTHTFLQVPCLSKAQPLSGTCPIAFLSVRPLRRRVSP